MGVGPVLPPLLMSHYRLSSTVRLWIKRWQCRFRVIACTTTFTLLGIPSPRTTRCRCRCLPGLLTPWETLNRLAKGTRIRQCFVRDMPAAIWGFPALTGFPAIRITTLELTGQTLGTLPDATPCRRPPGWFLCLTLLRSELSVVGSVL